MKHRFWTGVFVAMLLIIVGSVLIAACSQHADDAQQITTNNDRGMVFLSPEEFASDGVRSLAAPGMTAQPGLYWVWARPTDATPIARPTNDPYYDGNYPIGLDCLLYLDQVWGSAGAGNISHTQLDQCFDQTVTGTVKLGTGEAITLPVGLTIPAYFMTGGGSGTSGDPYNGLYFPAWMSSEVTLTEKYTSTGTTWYNGIHYDALEPILETYVNSVAAHEIGGVAMADNPRLAYVRVFAGYDGETQPARRDSGDYGLTDLQLIARHEAEMTSCADYKAFVVALGDAVAAAFPNTPVMVMAATQPCSTSNEYSWRKEIFGNWAATPSYIGDSMNGLVPDSSDAAGYPASTPAGWMKMDIADTINATSMPVGLEFRQPNPATVGDDKWQYVYWNFAAAMGTGSDYVFMQSAWRDYLSMDALNLIDRSIAGDVLAVTFRDYEYPAAYWVLGTGYSGYPEDFGVHAVVLTPRSYAQACNASVRATAVAAVTADAGYGWTIATPLPCAGGLLPTPAATLQSTPVIGDANILQRVANRQARMLTAGQVMGIAADTSWSYYGTSQDMTVRLVYLDTGTDSFQIKTYLGGSSYQTHTVVRGNTGNWKTTSVSLANASISNGLNMPGVGDAFITISNIGTDTLYVHDLQAGITAEGDTPTPTTTATATATATATSTSTSTNTPTVTPTPSVTPTATVWATPAYTVQACENIAVTVDGSLAEWTSVTPVALAADSAAYLFPDESDVVTASNFSMLAYCAYTDTNLYLGGVVTDSVVLSNTGWIDNGDAVRITIDSLADWQFKFREDDHELYFAPDDRSADFVIYPVADTLMTSVSGSGWTWEAVIGMPALGSGPLTPGKQMIFTWSYLDRDSGATWDHVIVGYPRRGQLQ